MQLSTDKMLAKKDGHIGWMTFNNPERRNAMSLEMWEATAEIMDAFQADPEIRVVVMQGAGDKAFVSGADISQFEKERADAAAAERYAKRSEAGRKAIRDFDRPIIAMIRGFCMGGGLGIAMSADLRFAAEGSTFGIPAARLSIAYTGENIMNLYNLVGPSRAKDILYSARRFPAEEALSIGLINRVFSPDSLESETRAYCETLAQNAPLSIKAHKVILGELSKKVPDFSKIDAVAEQCFNSADYKEGRTAFMEKRAPVWKGA
jgi:enoyl-CoA hydratase